MPTYSLLEPDEPLLYPDSDLLLPEALYSPDIPTLSASLKTRAMNLGLENLPILSEFYQDGQWHIGDENTSWYLGPSFAALAATMYRYDRNLTGYLNIAIETVDTAIESNLNTAAMTTPVYTYALTPNYPDSLFVGLSSAPKIMASFDSGAWGSPDSIGSDEAATIEFGATLVWITDMLYHSGGIDDAKAATWMQTAKYAADWLIDKNGTPIWYQNGSYVAQVALFFGHLATLSRKLGRKDDWLRYSQAYELTMQTLLYPFGNATPASAQWANYGYTVDAAGNGSSGTGTGPTHAALLTVGGNTSDGSTETGHLTEMPTHAAITPGVTNTFDGVNTMLQLDLLATLFIVNRDWRVNYLLNALWNKLEPLTDFDSYTVDCTGGSIQSVMHGWDGGYQNVIALLGRRASNRTNITNVNCMVGWDVMVEPNLGINAQIGIDQIQPATARQYRIGVATTLHAAHLVDRKL